MAAMGMTPIELFRSGNAVSARLQNVRIDPANADVDTYVDPATGAEWVRANGKGASSAASIDPSWTGKIWRLPLGVAYPATLALWEDDPGHWLWEPTQDMLLVDYRAALEGVNGRFLKV
jgi:hypothetical protein